jgi:hypothetical protein
LDELGIGADLMQIKTSNTKMLALPPSKLPGAPPPEAYPIIEAREYPPIVNIGPNADIDTHGTYFAFGRS